MKLPFRRSKSKSLPERTLQRMAVGAGLARLAMRQRTLHPHVMPSKGGGGLRSLRRG
jgi:hypothetical protein